MCIVYASMIVTNEGKNGATWYYKQFEIKYPVSFDTSGSAFKPNYELAGMFSD